MRQGDAFDEHFACGSAHRRRPPGPSITGAGHFGLFVISGGQNQDLFPVYSRATGPFYHQNFQAVISNVHRLVRAYLFGAVQFCERTSCHGYAQVGGVRTAQTL